MGRGADTTLHGPDGRFPETRASVVHAVRSRDAAERGRAFDALVDGYWKPAYKYVRIKWSASNEEAKDLTQAFFARAWEKGFFDSYDPARSAFRTFLRTCLDRFVSNERLAASRMKRGGDRRVLSLDFDLAERELSRGVLADAENPDAFFRQEWLRALFTAAVEDLRRDGLANQRERQFELFEACDLAEAPGRRRPTYADLGRRFGLTASQVTNGLSAARRRFRQALLARLRQMCGSDEEFRMEAREIFGIEADDAKRAP